MPRMATRFVFRFRLSVHLLRQGADSLLAGKLSGNFQNSARPGVGGVNSHRNSNALHSIRCERKQRIRAPERGFVGASMKIRLAEQERRSLI
jgi:hypothetical protein